MGLQETVWEEWRHNIAFFTEADEASLPSSVSPTDAHPFAVSGTCSVASSSAPAPSAVNASAETDGDVDLGLVAVNPNAPDWRDLKFRELATQISSPYPGLVLDGVKLRTILFDSAPATRPELIELIGRSTTITGIDSRALSLNIVAVNADDEVAICIVCDRIRHEDESTNQWLHHLTECVVQNAARQLVTASAEVHGLDNCPFLNCQGYGFEATPEALAVHAYRSHLNNAQCRVANPNVMSAVLPCLPRT